MMTTCSSTPRLAVGTAAKPGNKKATVRRSRPRHGPAILCAILAAVMMSGCRASLQQGLDETQANEIVTALERAGIAASKTRDEQGAFAVHVHQSDLLRGMELLRDIGLPRGARATFGEVFKHGSLVPTPTEEKARYTEALAGEIARTLESVDGVLSARVHLVLPEIDPLSGDGKPRVAARASVLLRARPPKPAIAEADVQKLVSGSVPGLERDAVAVIFTQSSARTVAPVPGIVSLGPLSLTAASRTLVVAIALIAAALLVLLAVLLLLTARRLAAAQRTWSDGEAHARSNESAR